MDIEMLKKLGAYLGYFRSAVFSKIPYTQDVLYALQLTDKTHERGLCNPASADNMWGIYMADVLIVAGAVVHLLFLSDWWQHQSDTVPSPFQSILPAPPARASCLFALVVIPRM